MKQLILTIMFVFTISYVWAQTPSKAFLGLEFTEGFKSTCYSLKQLISSVQKESTKKWKSTGKDKWILIIENKDPMTNKVDSFKFLFIKQNYLAQTSRIIMDNRELNKIEIQFIMRQFAFTLDEKTKQNYTSRCKKLYSK